jgi:hypothetical protein
MATRQIPNDSAVHVEAGRGDLKELAALDFLTWLDGRQHFQL